MHSRPCTPPTDERPETTELVRTWMEDVTGIVTPEVVPHDPPKGSPLYGELGDHRWSQLTTLQWESILVPARKYILEAVQSSVALLERKQPSVLRPLEGSQSDQVVQSLAVLKDARPVLVHCAVHESLSSLQFNPHNVLAGTMLPLKTRIVHYEGRWDLLSIAPQHQEGTWQEFLALNVHPGAYRWTRFLSSELAEHPNIVLALDHSAPGLHKAMDMTQIVPVEVNAWLPHQIVFHAFAARIHNTSAAEFRWQRRGFGLVYALIWHSWANASQTARNYRARMAEMQKWDECVYPGEAVPGEDRGAVAYWVRVMAKPGDVLLWAPGTLVLEYSSGASLTMEGSFLPWCCLPLIREISTAPATYVLMAMMLTASQDRKYERAAIDDILALLDILPENASTYCPANLATFRTVVKSFDEAVVEARKAVGSDSFRSL